MSNKLYDTMKWVAQILLPGVGALYFALAGLWNLPHAEQVVGTITAIDVFLGLILGLSARAYSNSEDRYDGTLDVAVEEEETTAFMLKLKKHPSMIAKQDSFTVKVVPK